MRRSILVIEEPRLSGFKNEISMPPAFEAQGQFLWRQLQQELGDTYEVFYFSHLTSQLLEKNEIEELIVYPHTKAQRMSVYLEGLLIFSFPRSAWECMHRRSASV